MKNFTITQLAAKFKVTTRTIRYYEELGILSPQRLDSKARLYSKKDETKLLLILRGKKFGFSLEEIKKMIILFDEDRSGKKQLEKTIEYGRRKIEEVKTQIEELTELKEEMEMTLDEFRTKLNQFKEEDTK